MQVDLVIIYIKIIGQKRWCGGQTLNLSQKRCIETLPRLVKTTVF